MPRKRKSNRNNSQPSLHQQLEIEAGKRGIPIIKGDDVQLNLELLPDAKKGCLIGLINYFLWTPDEVTHCIGCAARQLNLIGTEDHQLPEELIAFLVNLDGDDLAQLAVTLTGKLYFEL